MENKQNNMSTATKLLVITFVWGLAGCQTDIALSLKGLRPSQQFSSGVLGPEANTGLASRLSTNRYPSQSQRGQDLDIVVKRRWQVLELVNRTPNVYRGMQLWLNQSYMGEVDRIEIRDGNIVPLREIINQYGENYPVGGLLNPDKTFPVVVAELYDPRQDIRHRLLVID